MLETDIQSSICDYLALKRHFFWRQNNIPVSSDGNYRRMPAYSKKGVPDIILIKDGFFWGLEVKKPAPKKTFQSKDQKIFEEESKQVGAKYFVVRSIDDVIALGL